MSGYLNSRLAPQRKQHLEAHMDGCAKCIRAFIDLREANWRLRRLAQSLVTADREMSCSAKRIGHGRSSPSVTNSGPPRRIDSNPPLRLS